MSIEAMKLALDALAEYTSVVRAGSDPNKWNEVVDAGAPARKAVKALRTAIDQAEKPYDIAERNEDYERGFIDGMQKQMQSSVDKAVNAMSKKKWVGLTDEEYEAMAEQHVTNCYFNTLTYAKAVEAKLKEKNSG